MVTKSKLKMALAANKGTDFKKLHLKKKEKAAKKKNAKKGGAGKVEKPNGKKIEEEWEDVDGEDDSEDGGEGLGEGESGSEEDVDAPMQVCLRVNLVDLL
jgi:rRNA-processing protein EBP2